MQAEKYFLRRTWRRRKGWDFLSPRPMRGAARLGHRGRHRVCISIHAPLAGRDVFPFCDSNIPLISIHAPLAGRDSENWEWGVQNGYFNPRTPCGVRRPSTRFLPITSLFQSTHPLRGATITCSGPTSSPIFQSTHPLRGATSSVSSLICTCRDFNPRTPCGVRLA